MTMIHPPPTPDNGRAARRTARSLALPTLALYSACEQFGVAVRRLHEAQTDGNTEAAALAEWDRDTAAIAYHSAREDIAALAALLLRTASEVAPLPASAALATFPAFTELVARIEALEAIAAAGGQS